MPVDIVYTYVDGLDPIWLKKRNKYFNKTLFKLNSNVRYQHIDELNYSIKCVLKFAPWINNIYIVTDNQIPQIDNLDRVIIIDHRDIIPAKILPVFFSDVIESYLHNIPNLSEIFIYNNDDCFFFDKIYKSDIYVKNKVKIVNNFNYDSVKSRNSEYSIRIIKTADILHKIGCNSFIFNHVSKILHKSTLKYIEHTFSDTLIELRKSKFRNNTSIQYLFLAINIDNMLHRNITIAPTAQNYLIYNFGNSLYDPIKDNSKFIVKKCKFVCYNSMNNSYKIPFANLMEKIL
jgi:hypothetical protein